MSKLKKIGNMLWAILLLCSFTLAASPQQQGKRCSSTGNVYHPKDRPAVYITFERKGTREPLFADESNQGVWLRLHNNTHWAINFCTLSLYVGPKVSPLRLQNGRAVLGLRDDIEVNMCHKVEASKGYVPGAVSEGEIDNRRPVEARRPPVGYDTGDVFSTSWLPAGGSVVFSVPREHLADQFAIVISYNYEWEYGQRTFRNDEPRHEVYFNASDLPKNERN